VVNDAIAHDAELSAATSKVAMDREETPIARAELLPRLEGGWGRTYNQIKTDNLPTARYWQNGWMVTLSQPIFNWEQWVALRQANMKGARAELEYANAWQTLVLRSANTYLDLLSASQGRAQAAEYLQAVTRQLALIRKLQAGGEATVIDLDEAQSRLSEAQLRLQEASLTLDSRQRALASITGRDVALPQTPVMGRAQPWLKSKSLQQWVRQAETSSFAVQLGQMDVRNASEDIEKARAKFYPVVSFSASHAPSGAAAGYSEPTTTNSAMLTITAPLFSGGGDRARLRQANAGEEKAQNDLLAATRKSAADTQEWFHRFNGARERSQTLSEIVRHNEDTLAATRKGFLAGSRSNLEVLRAQEALFAGRTSQAKARYDMLAAFLALKAEVASLSLGDIQLLDNWLSTGAPEG
jgi:outer membrane protein